MAVVRPTYKEKKKVDVIKTKKLGSSWGEANDANEGGQNGGDYNFAGTRGTAST
jgi:hypothetical protein